MLVEVICMCVDFVLIFFGFLVDGGGYVVFFGWCVCSVCFVGFIID